MILAGAGGVALHCVRSQIAAQERDEGRAFAHGAEIDVERAGAVERAQRGDAIAQAREENSKRDRGGGCSPLVALISVGVRNCTRMREAASAGGAEVDGDVLFANRN